MPASFTTQPRRLREQVVDGIIVEDIGAIHFFDHGAGAYLGEAEAYYFFALALERFIDGGLKNLGVDRKLQFMALFRAFHF